MQQNRAINAPSLSKCRTGIGLTTPRPTQPVSFYFQFPWPTSLTLQNSTEQHTSSQTQLKERTKMLRILILVTFAVFAAAENKAIAVLRGSSDVTGRITFTEVTGGVLVEGEIKGLTPGKHGFHIHSKGDLTDGCGSTGTHFNPFNKTHGGPEAEIRHVGDLGNVIADDTKTAKVSIVDKVICLTGERGILGRAVVVHVGEDDLGLKDTEESRTTGSAGGRLACGVIGILSDDFKYSGGSGHTYPSIMVLFTSLIVYFKFW